MSTFLSLSIYGLADGAILALAALGFVLIYKATSVINFAQGEFLLVGAYTFYAAFVLLGLPIALASYAKMGVESDNRYPREEYDNLPPAKRRAYAAHQNAYENFPFFAVAVIVAMTLGAAPATVNMLAMAYVAVRVIHGLVYVNNIPSARSLAFGIGLLINIAIFVLPAFK